MFDSLRRRITYSNVVATLALFVALGGTSYAALKVTGKDVKDSSLTGADIKNSSLTTSDVKDSSLLAKDFKAGQLPAGPKGDKGDKGDPGTPGTNGTNGTNGAAGATNVTTRSVTQPVPVGDSELTSPCNAGEKAVGGGLVTLPADPEVTFIGSYPSPSTNGSTPTGWTARFTVTGIPHNLTAWAVCAAP